MVAAREEGYIKFTATNPEGGSVTLMGYKDTRELAPSGKIAEPDKWYVMPLAGIALNGTNGWKVNMIMKSEATDILDNANDSIFKIPAVINGVLTTIGKDEFQQGTSATFASPSLTAGVDVIIGQYPIPAGTVLQLGGAKAWIEPYDDTA